MSTVAHFAKPPVLEPPQQGVVFCAKSWLCFDHELTVCAVFREWTPPPCGGTSRDPREWGGKGARSSDGRKRGGKEGKRKKAKESKRSPKESQRKPNRPKRAQESRKESQRKLKKAKEGQKQAKRKPKESQKNAERKPEKAKIKPKESQRKSRKPKESQRKTKKVKRKSHIVEESQRKAKKAKENQRKLKKTKESQKKAKESKRKTLKRIWGGKRQPGLRVLPGAFPHPTNFTHCGRQNAPNYSFYLRFLAVFFSDIVQLSFCDPYVLLSFFNSVLSAAFFPYYRSPVLFLVSALFSTPTFWFVNWFR